MNDKVMDFPPEADQRQYIFRCNCGSELFRLYKNGDTICDSCNKVMNCVRVYDV